MASTPSSSQAIDSFLEYFREAKPYHTKLLEVVEKYTFFESMDVNFVESIKKQITIQNEPLCKQTGFGLDYDDNCGYDAIDCCDLFDCSGGYGIIFDNSDLVASELIVAKNDTEGFFEVEGNHTIDTRYKVLNIIDNQTMLVEGNASVLINQHSIFLDVNVLPYDVVSNSPDSLVISGSHVDFINTKTEFWVTGTETAFNGKYVVRSATYDTDNNETTVNFIYFGSVGVNDLQGLQINFRSSDPNVGIYQIAGGSFDGTNTTLSISNGTFNLTDSDLTEYQKGSIQFRTAFKYSREIEIDLSPGSNYHNILYVEYVFDTNRTKIYVDGDISPYAEGIDLLNMFGYFFNSGFDGSAECLQPKETHIYALMEEKLVIRVDDSNIV